MHYYKRKNNELNIYFRAETNSIWVSHKGILLYGTMELTFKLNVKGCNGVIKGNRQKGISVKESYLCKYTSGRLKVLAEAQGARRVGMSYSENVARVQFR